MLQNPKFYTSLMLVFLGYSECILLIAEPPSLNVILAIESPFGTHVNILGWVSNINENILNILKSNQCEGSFISQSKFHKGSSSCL